MATAITNTESQQISQTLAGVRDVFVPQRFWLHWRPLAVNVLKVASAACYGCYEPRVLTLEYFGCLTRVESAN